MAASEEARPIPIPPFEMRQLVGPTDVQHYDNPNARLLFPYLAPSAYEAVFDFGCGCGRNARQLIQQRPQPKRYVGIDLHKGMIEWCKRHLQPIAPQFEFYHHDVFSLGFNPGRDKPTVLPFSVPDGTFSLVNAWSVFTHVTEAAAVHYFREAARILAPTGIFQSTWFLFDKTYFPMMQEFQNALFINDVSPINAVIFDKTWLRKMASEADLTIYFVRPPRVRGFQWLVLMTPRREGVVEVDFPSDDAPFGIRRPPVPQVNVAEIGLKRRD